MPRMAAVSVWDLVLSVTGLAIVAGLITGAVWVVQDAERITQEHAAYVLVHRQAVNEWHEWSDVLQSCQEWLSDQHGDVELSPYVIERPDLTGKEAMP